MSASTWDVKDAVAVSALASRHGCNTRLMPGVPPRLLSEHLPPRALGRSALQLEARICETQQRAQRWTPDERPLRPAD